MSRVEVTAARFHQQTQQLAQTVLASPDIVRKGR